MEVVERLQGPQEGSEEEGRSLDGRQHLEAHRYDIDLQQKMDEKWRRGWLISCALTLVVALQWWPDAISPHHAKANLVTSRFRSFVSFFFRFHFFNVIFFTTGKGGGELVCVARVVVGESAAKLKKKRTTSSTRWTPNPVWGGEMLTLYAPSLRKQSCARYTSDHTCAAVCVCGVFCACACACACRVVSSV